MSRGGRKNAQAEGPWGQDPGQQQDENPWGNREDRARGRRPETRSTGPQIDQLILDFQKRIKKIFPDSELGNGGVFLSLALVILLLWLSTGFYLVSEGEVGLVQRFGKYVETTYPGLRYHWPSPVEKATIVRVNQINQVVSGLQIKGTKPLISEETSNFMLTGDENILSLTFSVLWFIKDPVQYLFMDPAPQQTVKLAAESAVREVIAQTTIADALTKGKDKIVRDSKKLLQKMVDEYGVGIEIQQVNLIAVNPPQQVIHAYRDVQRARADRESKINEARAYFNALIPRTRGLAQATIEKAKAYRESTVEIARGEVARFLAVLKAYEASPQVTEKRIYIDTLSKLLQGSQKIIVEGGNSQNVLPYLPLPSLEALKKEQTKDKDQDTQPKETESTQRP